MKKPFWTISALLALLLLIFLLYKKYFAPIEFHKVDAFTRIDEADSSLREIYVVPNPPGNLDRFKAAIYAFNSANSPDTKYKSCNRLFIKEHYPSLSNWFWGEKTKYLASPPAEIDNIDFLGKTSWYQQRQNGKDTVTYHFYSGLGRFYDE